MVTAKPAATAESAATAELGMMEVEAAVAVAVVMQRRFFRQCRQPCTVAMSLAPSLKNDAVIR